ncbi:natterin-3-like [Drosophila tropicalis]|uniref:natterin-3-like n=1 Tax=Drosophila tropicalis TaxID=46794 RepID=UPI0035ABD768
MAHWIRSSADSLLPPTAFQAGHDTDGSRIYVGRTMFEGDLAPVKVIPNKHAAYVSHGGKEHSVMHFEVLVGKAYAWAPSSNGCVPGHAISTGKTRMGEPLYNSLTVGKVHPSHGCLYVPFGGKEISIKSYEVLVKKLK